MKWELISLGIGWGIFLFKLYQQSYLLNQLRQYRMAKRMYHNQNVLQQVPSQKKEVVLFDSQNRIPLQQAELQQLKVPNSATQFPKIEGKQVEQNQFKNNKLETTMLTNFDETEYVVFPQLYPHLRKKKNLIKKSVRNIDQRSRLRIKRRRQSKNYKQWFVNNRVLVDIQQSGHMTAKQIQENYQKLTVQIKKSAFVQGHNTMSDSARSQQGTQLQIGQIMLKRDNEKKQHKKLNNHFLDELQDEEVDGLNNQFKVQKYDPFS